MGVEVAVNTEQREAPVGLLERAIRRVLTEGGRDQGEVSLTLLGDQEISALNQEYLARDHPTDVISFSLGTPDRLIGDVYVGYDQAARQAVEAGVGLDEELVRLAVHGTLHVLGHDHPEGPERLASPMFVLQERLVAEILAPS